MGEIPTKHEMQCALEKRHGKILQDRFSGATVAVCGLGGLGSNIAIALARAGIGKLILIDFDRVDISNLHRQQYCVSQIGLYKTQALAQTLCMIAPYTEISAHTVRITHDNLQDLLGQSDIICEAFDDAEQKAMLVNGVLEKLPDTYLIAASGMAGLSSANEIETRRISSRFYLCGDGKSDVDSGVGLVSARVMLCAAHQAHMALRILAGEFQA